MSFKPTLRRFAAATLLALAGTSQAAIVEGADVGGIRTFVDTTTGTVWADLDNHLAFTGAGYGFRFTDYADYLAALTAAGFTWALSSEVSAFMASNPLATTAEYAALGTVMGSLSFGETTTLSGYSNATNSLVQRQYGAPDFGAGTASWAFTGPLIAPSALNDSGLWAYLAGPGGGGGGNVPLPGTLALAGLGLVAMAARPAGRRRATA